MKASNILSLVAVVLASEVSANCFSETLGYSCCENTTEVVHVDENGEWGIENGQWCGIQSVASNAIPETYSEDEISSEEEVSVNVDDNNVEEDSFSEEETSTIIPSEYMSKLNVVNTCPVEASTFHDGVTYPTAQKVYYYSNTTKSERPLNIILPVNYSEDKKYPVVYFLHGIFCNEDTMLEDQYATIQIPTNLLNEGKTKEFIMVLPNTYAPQDGNAVEASFAQEYFDGYDNFINDLTENIMPYIESTYSVATGRDNTAICGFSMGGRNSLYIGYKRPDLFGYVGAFSPAPGVTPGTDFSGYHKGLFTEDEFRTDNTPYVTLISCGTNDSVVQQFPKSYHEILTRNNQEHIWFEVPGADHDGPAVNAGLYNFLSTVFESLN